MRVFPTHFNKRFEKHIKHITVLLVPILRPYVRPYFPFVGPADVRGMRRRGAPTPMGAQAKDATAGHQEDPA